MTTTERERADEARDRSIHDEEVQVMRERAAKQAESKQRKPMTYDEWARMTFTEGD